MTSRFRRDKLNVPKITPKDFPNNIDDNIKYLSTIGDGSCLLHSIVQLVSKDYRRSNHSDKSKIVKQIREKLDDIAQLRNHRIKGDGDALRYLEALNGHYEECSIFLKSTTGEEEVEEEVEDRMLNHLEKINVIDASKFDLKMATLLVEMSKHLNSNEMEEFSAKCKEYEDLLKSDEVRENFSLNRSAELYAFRFLEEVALSSITMAFSIDPIFDLRDVIPGMEDFPLSSYYCTTKSGNNMYLGKEIFKRTRKIAKSKSDYYESEHCQLFASMFDINIITLVHNGTEEVEVEFDSEDGDEDEDEDLSEFILRERDSSTSSRSSKTPKIFTKTLDALTPVIFRATSMNKPYIIIKLEGQHYESLVYEEENNEYRCVFSEDHPLIEKIYEIVSEREPCIEEVLLSIGLEPEDEAPYFPFSKYVDPEEII